MTGQAAIADHELLGIDGPAAPPRANGELVFAEPWESRAFGMAVTLHNAGVFEWDDFRERLVARIADWESGHAEGECFNYYRCWLTALEDLAVEQSLIDGGALSERAETLAARPAGHDH